jgi:dihydroorotate dehydrogenase (NAD+) catalytic subunit
MADLTCKLLHLQMRNPLVLASGVIGTSASILARAGKAGAGAVTSKSCGPVPRAGHPNPITLDWGYGVINAVGLTNPGAKEELEVLKKAKPLLHALGIPLVASIFAGTVDQFGEVARIIAEAEPDLLEVDISCPNVDSEFGLPFSAETATAAKVTEAVKRAVNIPVSIKLGPNVPNIGRIAAAVADAGANAITAINTMPGMIIDARAAKPVLYNKIGGISGPALKPIALRCVADIARTVKIPIIGTGGVSNGTDAVEMIMAGATAVGIGTAIWYRGVDVFAQIAAEMNTFMDEEHYPNLESMRGKAVL